MGRYVNTISTPRSPENITKLISTYLTREGFKQIDSGQNLWKRGMGLMLGPQYVRFEATPGNVRLEAWIKFALLPGVYLGEMGVDGMFAIIPKRKLKARVVEIEKMSR